LEPRFSRPREVWGWSFAETIDAGDLERLPEGSVTVYSCSCSIKGWSSSAEARGKFLDSGQLLAIITGVVKFAYHAISLAKKFVRSYEVIWVLARRRQ